MSFTHNMQHIIGKHGQIKELKNGTFELRLKVNAVPLIFKKHELPKYLAVIEPTHSSDGHVVLYSGWFGGEDDDQV